MKSDSDNVNSLLTRAKCIKFKVYYLLDATLMREVNQLTLYFMYCSHDTNNNKMEKWKNEGLPNDLWCEVLDHLNVQFSSMWFMKEQLLSLFMYFHQVIITCQSAWLLKPLIIKTRKQTSFLTNQTFVICASNANKKLV